MVAAAEAGVEATPEAPLLPPLPPTAAAVVAEACLQGYMTSCARRREAPVRWCIPPRAIVVVVELILVSHHHHGLPLLRWNYMLLPRLMMLFIIDDWRRREGGRTQREE